MLGYEWEMYSCHSLMAIDDFDSLFTVGFVTWY